MRKKPLTENGIRGFFSAVGLRFLRKCMPIYLMFRSFSFYNREKELPDKGGFLC